MVRPTKKRTIENIPQVKYFKPAGIPMREIGEINLSLEEVEALRLKDLEGLIQQECADKMNVSRPTFQRILVKAREKVARALLQGKAIRFKGGDYKLARGAYYCQSCDYVLEISSSGRGRGPHRHRGGACPECGSRSLTKQVEKGEDKEK